MYSKLAFNNYHEDFGNKVYTYAYENTKRYLPVFQLRTDNQLIISNYKELKIGGYTNV